MKRPETRKRERRGLRFTTFFQSEGSDAKQEMAATIQQLPRLPWCKSRVLMPSTNKRGSLHISWRGKDAASAPAAPSPVAPRSPPVAVPIKSLDGLKMSVSSV